VRFIVANWKSNKTIAEVKDWLDKVRQAKITAPKKTEIVLCPSSLHLAFIKKELEAQPLAFDLKLGGQNISAYPEGAYTGEIAARMLAEFVDYVLVGHSERRRYFRETDRKIELKTVLALKNKITPIIAFSKLSQAKLAVRNLASQERKKVLFMYEPPEAISKQIGPVGVGRAASLDQVLSMVKKIKALFPHNKVLYGGSVKSHNIFLYFSQPEVDGVVPGTASLNAEEFIKLIKNAKTQA
jgi:triosephosphate isomerase